jgi:hypothetical protein
MNRRLTTILNLYLIYVLSITFFGKKEKRKNAFHTSIGLSWNTSDAKYKGPKMKVVGGLFGPWSYV